MRLHLEGLEDYAQSTITTEHVQVVGALTVEQLKQKKEHNQEMLETSYSLGYSEFDDIKGCDFAKKMQDSLQKIYGGDKNVLRAKAECLRRKIDE